MNIFYIIIRSTISFCYPISFCGFYPFILFSTSRLLSIICLSVIRYTNFYCPFSKVLESKFILK
nr:MAG TPA: hypothetical protein [Caudoviricetes sp.]DAN63496.1 MAG TPA: hypothetical protein [Caudoviricetes sp.]